MPLCHHKATLSHHNIHLPITVLNYCITLIPSHITGHHCHITMFLCRIILIPCLITEVLYPITMSHSPIKMHTIQSQWFIFHSFTTIHYPIITVPSQCPPLSFDNGSLYHHHGPSIITMNHCPLECPTASSHYNNVYSLYVTGSSQWFTGTLQCHTAIKIFHCFITMPILLSQCPTIQKKSFQSPFYRQTFLFQQSVPK